MKTTLVLPDPVLARVRKEAERTRTSQSAVVEAALRAYFAPGARAEKDDLPPLPVFDSGGHLVDIADRDALYAAMDDTVAAASAGSVDRPVTGRAAANKGPPDGARARRR